MKPETWKDIPGYETRYQVSDHGQVRSLPRIASNNRSLKGRTLRPGTVKGGYKIVWLYLDGQRNWQLVHRLVLESFVGQCPKDMEGCHKDGDPSNNILTNLRWDSHSNNIIDSVAHGTHCSNKRKQPVQRSDGITFESVVEASNATEGADSSHIVAACRGKRKSAGGFQWKYV